MLHFLTMNDDSRIASILLPLALDQPYSYLVPAGMELEAGDYVKAPLGPRQVEGVVWAMGNSPPKGTTLRKVTERFDLPAMPAVHRKFIDWVAAYYLSPPGMVLRSAMRA
ncbi:MAG TPA: primosomal protein N', partial [Rhizobiales bacterium]|nr:primosomal protein N' [Hyphomicrobiales bacterium]